MSKIKCYFQFLFILLLGTHLSACSRPEVTPPSVEPVLLRYLDVLQTGNLEEVEQLYFMPLHWRSQQKMYKHFSEQYKLLAQKKLSLSVISFKQKGRWALSVIERKQSGESQVNPLWFFYYDHRWQVISPVIFKTAPVRSMMDLYREQNDLRSWYETELAHFTQ